jgi:hypothetical protein
MPVRLHGELDLEVDGAPVHLSADGANWRATVSRFGTVRKMLAAPPPLPAPLGSLDVSTLPAKLAEAGISLEIRDRYGSLLHLGRSAGSGRLRIPFVLDVPHARISGPLALIRLLF